MIFTLYRFNPETDKAPYNQELILDETQIKPGMMLLDALKRLKQQDPSLTFRSSCQEGVCGSDGMNVNGENKLACITPLAELGKKVILRPLPGLPVIRDLVVDMTQFYQHYDQVEPYLQTSEIDLNQEHLQTPMERAKLDGNYECILCGCCTTSCPSFWWNPDKFAGPAALLAAHRFISDSRDIQTRQRLTQLDDPYTTFRCRNIQNCTASCPKGLDPSQAISEIKQQILEKS
ncbi:succinate dehydrogenase iron-sulfur subunit [Thiomicrospira microaerophila]|uniref:succinate dehydrogenase iron-sulfur subunit n=1 Tax=Thiomicrospira microaerophila TaxID=406020 RepID=UPI00200CD06F|nr:succinate dehydrogenase iron-sulfur subunit [Thiomicrospira microaerophila]UQB41412.1 succinate dehydrogenase iron-sulfur subunit [Thiomicrospira microaerophila]